MYSKTAREGLFSGGTGLFDDDNDDDSFWKGTVEKRKDSAVTPAGIEFFELITVIK